MNQKHYLLGEAARALGCHHYQITYMLAAQKIPEPLRFGNRRLFTTKDLARIAELLKSEAAKTNVVTGGQHVE
jgi:DNA-binding transcriptional MerR regulator